MNVGDLDDGQTPMMATADNEDVTVDQSIENRCRCMRSLLAAGAEIDLTDCFWLDCIDARHVRRGTFDSQKYWLQLVQM